MLIVDVGSGNNPFPLANVLIDLYPEDNRHRSNGEPLVRDGRTFLQADVCHLPFGDKEVDFIWCAEVLEHLEHPDDAFRELQRVAKAGLITCPTFTRELAYSKADPEGWSTHRWFVFMDHDIMRFVQKEGYDVAKDGIPIGSREHVVATWGDNVWREESPAVPNL